MASFIRQLNMYGFRKVVHMEQGGLLKPEKDDTEFQHPLFVRGQEHLLENIKRKVTNVSSARPDEGKISSHEVSKLLSDVQAMKGKQETMDSKIMAMKHENEALWREVVCLRQKHTQQQKMVSKLIHFLVSLVQSNRIMGVKRKLPLMLNDSGSAHSLPKYARTFSLESVQAAPSILSPGSSVSSGPIISDVTELAMPPPAEAVSEWMQAGKGPSVEEEEPVAPDVAGDTPLSPTTFINSILQDSDAPDAGVLTAAVRPRPAAADPDAPSSCQTVVCIDKLELSDHVETIDSNLENLQNILNSQTFTFDTLPLMEFFNPSCPPGDFDISALDTLLCDNLAKGAEESDDAGKQLVQYTPVQICEAVGAGEGGGGDLPALLELEADPFLSPDLSASLNPDL
ncbi:heat shock factor protein 1 isoform X1 [Vanacampus margaritifer]